jgi:uncharacterized protein YjbI with pentapeptide repeats
MPRLSGWIRQSVQRQPVQRPNPQHRLGPIGVAIVATVGSATSVVVLLVFGALKWFRPTQVGEHLEVVKLALAVVAGIGGVVALVVTYRRQRLAEAGEDRELSRLYAERFDSASDKLGSESAAVRLAGVHALANLADDWPDGRQTCIDVLCAYLRMPPAKGPDPESDPDEYATWLAMREVRTTILRLIAAHLRRDASASWQGSNYDFAGVTFDADADFTDAVFSGGDVNFSNAKFSDSHVDFSDAVFSGGRVNFSNARFSSGVVNFGAAKFAGGDIRFWAAEFSGGEVDFGHANFSGSDVSFSNAKFSDGFVHFSSAEFSGGEVDFSEAEFSDASVNFISTQFIGGRVDFDKAKISSGEVDFSYAKFADGDVHFGEAKFSGGEVNFSEARFSGGEVDFSEAEFSGSDVCFPDAEFSGGKVDLSRAIDWSHPPQGLPTGSAFVRLPR